MEEGRNPASLRVLLLKIVVDVARDGEPLFVDGRHRLSIAKILGVEQVPVVIRLRHEDIVPRPRSSPRTSRAGDVAQQSSRPSLFHR